MLQPAHPVPVANVEEARFRCREAIDALSDIEIFVAGYGHFTGEESLFIRQNLNHGQGAVMTIKGALDRISARDARIESPAA